MCLGLQYQRGDVGHRHRCEKRIGLLTHGHDLHTRRDLFDLSLRLPSDTAADALAVLGGVSSEEGEVVTCHDDSFCQWPRLLAGDITSFGGSPQRCHWRRIGIMVELKDPARDELVRELRAFRKGTGAPTAVRMTGLFYLNEALGEGVPERAFEELNRLYEQHGQDPETSIGAFFYLSGWGIGLTSVDQRRAAYRDAYFADISTAWRRSERGIAELVTLIRDRGESHRPWAFVSIFQHRNTFQPFLDFNLGYESWQKPVVFLDEEEMEIDFHVHQYPETQHRYTRRIVLPESPLNLDVGFAEPMARLSIAWNMPIWPVWSVASWTADPRILTHLRTFRQRAVEVSLQWWRKTPPDQVDGLVSDGAIWAERQDPNRMNLPEGWKME